MLTEKEAWLKIAQWFKVYPRIISVKSYYHNYKLKANFNGICWALNCLRTGHKIDYGLEQLMLGKIELYRKDNKIVKTWFWSLDKDGAQQRVKFCLEQASKL